jgi:hypothetical protein
MSCFSVSQFDWPSLTASRLYVSGAPLRDVLLGGHMFRVWEGRKKEVFFYVSGM